MRNIIAATCLLIGCGIASAETSSDQYAADLGLCLAFAYVKADLDGERAVPDAMKPGLSALSSEYMFETSLKGTSADDAHRYVVDQLVQLNQFKTQHGIEMLDTQYTSMCNTIAERLAVAQSNQ